MTESYDDIKREYNAYVSRVRSFLAATRSNSTLKECERLLSDAQRCATDLQRIADSEDNPMLSREAQQRFDRELAPLKEEVSNALGNTGTGGGGGNSLYQPPNSEGGSDLFNSNYDLPDTSGLSMETQQLISSSHSMLRESQALCIDSENIGNATLSQMEQQREQLQNSSDYANQIRNLSMQARIIMKKMHFKMMRNKIILYFIIILLIIANILALKHLINRKHHK